MTKESWLILNKEEALEELNILFSDENLVDKLSVDAKTGVKHNLIENPEYAELFAGTPASRTINNEITAKSIVLRCMKEKRCELAEWLISGSISIHLAIDCGNVIGYGYPESINKKTEYRYASIYFVRDVENVSDCGFLVGFINPVPEGE